MLLMIIWMAKLVSTTRRLNRFLENAAINVREWYRPISQQWLQAQWHCLGEIRLIVDGTKAGYGHQLLMVSLAYRKRAIPIAWTWVKLVLCFTSKVGHLSLVGAVQRVESVRQFQSEGWSKRLAGSGYLTTKNIFPNNLLIHWQVGEAESWCLAANLPDREMALHSYRRRMWCEMHGFDLERTMSHDFLKLSRLTLVVAFLYAWLISAGSTSIHAGLRHLVDRHDRRDLSIFQIGLRFIKRRLTNGLSFHIPLCTCL